MNAKRLDMAQPQVTLNDYFGGKSIVLRSVPEDFFKPYATFLMDLTGKWNPNLKDPSGQGTLGGWIFPKTREIQVWQGIQQIISGQVPAQSAIPRAPTTGSLNPSQIQPLTTFSPQQPFFQTQQSTNTLQQLLSAAQARNMNTKEVLGTQSPTFSSSIPVATLPSPNFLFPVTELPGTVSPIQPGYQKVTYIAIKPETGDTLQLTLANQKIPVKVKSAEVHDGITNSAVIELPDGQTTMIKLTNDQWYIPRFDQVHSISLK